MGSFTQRSALNIMRALFPLNNTAQNNITATNAAGTEFRIYNNFTGAGSQWGIYATGTKVIHQCHLVAGTTVATGQSIGASGLTDTNFQTSAELGNISSTTTAGGTMSYPTNTGTTYNGYTGKSMGTTGSANHTWTGWTIADPAAGALPSAVSTGQIGFPTLGTGSVQQNIYGFVICAIASEAATATAQNILSANAGGAPVIVAYGDLSNARALTAGDTPVFAAGAITITLD